MAKSYCTYFPNCSALGVKFGVPTETWNAYINVYNMYASAEDKISPTATYTAEQLDEIYDKINKQREARQKDTAYRVSERAAAEKFVGGPEAFALKQVSEVFTGEEIDGITCEIARMFVSSIEKNAAIYGNSIEDNIKKYGMNFFIKQVINTYLKAYNLTIPAVERYKAEVLAGRPATLLPVPGLYTTFEEAEASYKYLKKLIRGDAQQNLDTQLLQSMIVQSLSLINSMLDIKVKADFTVDNTAGVAYELADSIRDLEEHQQERWQQSLDSQNFEGTISSIVNRILMQVPRTKLVTEVTFEENADGDPIANPETHIEFEKSPIFKKDLLSIPAVVARRLFSSLSWITTEQEIIPTLRHSVEYQGLADALERDPRLRTTFFQEFNKYLQVCRAAELEATADGTLLPSVTPLNIGSRNDGYKTYKDRINTGRLSDNSFFKYEKSEKTGKYVPSLKSYTQFYGIHNWFKLTFLERDSDGKSIFDKSDLTKQEALLAAALDFANIPSTSKALGEILFDSAKKSAFIGEMASLMDAVESVSTNWKLFALFNNVAFRESTGAIMSLLGINPKSSYKSQATYAGSTISTMILNSPVSILAKKINGLYDATIDGKLIPNLTDYLTSKYLNSPQYKAGNRILNRWLADFLACGDDVAPNAKNIFGFVRDLGINNAQFEDINEEEHMAMSIFGYLKGRDWGADSDVSVKLLNSEAEINPKDSYTRQIILGTPKMFFHGRFTYRTDPAYIRSFITGDTNALRQIRTIHYYEPEILSGVYDLFLADKANQAVIKRFNELGYVFSANGKETFASYQGKDEKGNKRRFSNENKFGILKFLNENHTENETWYNYFLQKGAKKLNFEGKSLTAEQIAAIEADEDTFKEVVKEYFNGELVKFKKSLESMGFLAKTKDGKYVYFNNFIGSNSANPEASLDAVLRDYLVNYKFSQYNQAHLFHVSPLFFTGVEDMQKRNKGVLTNGYVLSMQAMDSDGNYVWDYNPQTDSFDFTSKVVYFKDLKVAMDAASKEALIAYHSNFMTEQDARDYIDDVFSNNSLTDGQAYRTLESYRKVLLSAGLSFWSEKQEAAYKRIMEIVTPIREARGRGEIKVLTSSQIQEIENLIVEFQPIKPINDGIETFGSSNLKVGFQFKYAEVPIIPELLPVGSKLRELGDEMIDRGIDMLASDKCLKKGSFGEMDLQYKKVNGKYVDSQGNILPGMDANGELITDGSQTSYQQLANPQNKGKFVEWESGTSVKEIFDAHRVSSEEQGFVTHIIPMENYLIQSNIPDHTDGNSTLGTQGRKIGTGAIKEGTTYTVGEQKQQVDGKQMARIYGAAHAAKYMKSFGKFMDKINNSSSVISDLIYNSINNGRGNLATVQRLMLADGLNPTIPFGEPSNVGDINSNIISIFKKTVIRQLISGGSIVQASSMGCGKEALKDTGLKAVFIEKEKTKENGEKVKSKIPVAMQTEMPFDFHFTDKEGNMLPLRYEDYCDENGYFLDAEGNAITEDRYDTAKPKIEIDFPGILDLVAYRIPTEMEYSMFHLRIVRCNPKNAGNTIKLPAECTSIAGFDFDIDKLFLMRHNFSTKEDISNEDVWESFYSKNQAFWQALGSAWEEDGRPEGRKWYTYWDRVLQDNPSWQDEYGDRDALFNAERARLLTSRIDKTPIDFNMNPADVLNLSVGQLDNLLVDCMISILSDESTVKDRYTSGGFTEASLDAKIMRLLEAGAWNPEVESFSSFVSRAASMDDVKPEYDYSDPMTAIIFKEQNQIAGTLIGIFANDSVNNFISKGLGVFKIAKSTDRILFGSLLDGVTEVDGAESRLDTSDIGYSFLHNTVNGVSIKRTLAQLLAAAVDAVKDPVLNYLNLNSITADAAAMLARLGYTTRDIGLLLNQPIVRQACHYMNSTGESNITRALVAVLEKQGVENAKDLLKPGKVADSTWLSSAALAANLPKEAKVNLKSQISVAQLFNTVMSVKSDFSNFVQKTRNTSANTIKSRFEDYLSTEQKSDRETSRLVILTKAGANPIDTTITLEDLTNPEKMHSLLEKYKDHPFIYEQIVYNIIRVGMHEMMDKFTLYSTPLYYGYRDLLKDLTAPWGISGDQIELLHSDMATMLISSSSFEGDFNPLYVPEGSKMSNAIRYMASDEEGGFISDLFGFLQDNPALAVGPLFNAIDIEGVGKDGYRLRANISKSLSEKEKLAITLSWDSLMKAGGMSAEMAKGLYLHFYYHHGLNPRANRLMELAPVSVLKALKVADGLSYVDFFSKDNPLYEGGTTSPDSKYTALKNLYQFILAHNDDSKLVKEVSATVDSSNKNLIIFNKGGKNGLDKVALRSRKQNGKVTGTYYSPIIKVDGNLYVLATLQGEDYAIDYDNVKSNNISTLAYIAVTEQSIREDSPELYNKLFKYYNNNNGLIFKYNRSAMTVRSVIAADDVEVDIPSGDNVADAYDNASDKTKNQETVSSDGRKQC